MHRNNICKTSLNEKEVSLLLYIILNFSMMILSSSFGIINLKSTI